MSENQKSSREQGMGKYFFRASAADFKKIPGSPVAYWVSSKLRDAFEKFSRFADYSDTRIGLITGDNSYYIRQWSEVSFSRIGFNFSRDEAKDSGRKWFPQSKGGDFRRWFGNNSTVLDWSNDGYELQTRLHESGERILAHNFNLDRIFEQGITWTKISSGTFAARYQPNGFLFNDASANAFPLKSESTWFLLGLLSSKIPVEILKAMNPTLNFLPGNIAGLPISPAIVQDPSILQNAKRAVELSKTDWDSTETAWDFGRLPLLHSEHRQASLKASYQKLGSHWREMTLEMQRLEEENNRIFIDAYGLQDELTPEVPLNEITLTCNPHYRYGGNKSEEDLEALRLADTLRELVSYAVGCMLGRYSLDKPGLILANQGETLADYLAQVPEPRFAADDDNVIPMLDGDWFPDDITLRFRQFLRVAFGEAHYEDNLAFIEQALNIKGKRNYGLRDFFLGEFYVDHVKRYKKRPIYWLFSSPKGSFNALIYMHRYRPDTVSVVLKYLRDYREKLSTEKERQAAVSINPGSSQGEKTKALKEVDRLAKVLTELEDYERDTLYPLATEQVQIDLDDGVKVNYLKFGAALKKIAGLEAKDED